MQRVGMLTVNKLTINMLSAIQLNVVMLIEDTSCLAERHYTECQYVKSHGATAEQKSVFEILFENFRRKNKFF